MIQLDFNKTNITYSFYLNMLKDLKEFFHKKVTKKTTDYVNYKDDALLPLEYL